MIGLSTMGRISLGAALVAGRKRVPSPATGKTTFITCSMVIVLPPDTVINEACIPQRFRIVLIASIEDNGGFHLGFHSGEVRMAKRLPFRHQHQRVHADERFVLMLH